MKYQISNLKYQIFNKKFSKNESGFTLIELLVVMIAFMITGTVIASVIFTHVKAIDKTNTETSLRQAGNGIISQISKDIRNAGVIELKELTTDLDTNKIKIQSCDSLKKYQVLYTYPKLDPQNDSSYQCVSSLSNIRRHTGGTNPAASAAYLLVDTNSMVVTKCEFTCQVTPGALPVITISFTLEEKTTSATTKSKSIGDKVSIPFTTPIQVRNSH